MSAWDCAKVFDTWYTNGRRYSLQIHTNILYRTLHKKWVSECVCVCTCQCIKTYGARIHGNSSEKFHHTYFFGTWPIATSMVSKPLNTVTQMRNVSLKLAIRAIQITAPEKNSNQIHETIIENCKISTKKKKNGDLSDAVIVNVCLRKRKREIKT